MMQDKTRKIIEENERAFLLLWLRITVVICLYLASISVLDAFVTLFSYWGFLAGRMDPNLHQDWYGAFQKIQESPSLFIIMNLYNIVIWNGVIVCSIWLLRYHVWSCRLLGALLGLDMVVTVVHLLFNAWGGSLALSSPAWFIIMNALQVGAIIVLAHPRIVGLLEQFSEQRKQITEPLRHSDIQ